MPLIQPYPHPTSRQFPNLPEGCCLILTGMAAAGKSTVGRRLAKDLDWAFADSDHIIEAVYGAPLQRVADALDKEAFLDLECEIILSLRLRRCVLSTGGSVVYREEAMLHLADMGPIVHLEVDLPVILERIARNPDRGLAIAPGQSVEDLFQEREALYRKYSSFSLDCTRLNPAECAAAVAAGLHALQRG